MNPYRCTVYTDGIHIVSNDVEFLHVWARYFGIKRHWFHGVRKGHPHYDKPARVSVDDLIGMGAVLVTKRKVLAISKESAS